MCTDRLGAVDQVSPASMWRKCEIVEADLDKADRCFEEVLSEQKAIVARVRDMMQAIGCSTAELDALAEKLNEV